MSCNWEEVEFSVRVYQRGVFQNGRFYGHHGFLFKPVEIANEVVDFINLTSPGYGVCNFRPAFMMMALLHKKIPFRAPYRSEYAHASHFDMVQRVKGRAAHFPAADLMVHRIGQVDESDIGIRLHDVTVGAADVTASSYVVQLNGLSGLILN